MQRLDVSHLKEVPETMLWALYNRAVEARRPDALLQDPEAVRIADMIAYDYERSFGKPEPWQVLRALRTDQVLRYWLTTHPKGQVVALGEGLETQFSRVDNGSVHWFAIDLPEAIAVRRVFLPDSERHHNLACSALDTRWLGLIHQDRPTFITAVGLLKYLQPAQVQFLISTIAERLPGVELAFDVMPRLLVRLAQQGRYRKGRQYRVPAMHWGLNRNELHTMKLWHPNILEVTELPFRGGRGFESRVLYPLCHRIPWVRNHLFSLVHIRCR